MSDTTNFRSGEVLTFDGIVVNRLDHMTDNLTYDDYSLILNEAVPGMLKPNKDVDEYIIGEKKSIKFKNKRALVAQLCDVSNDFATYRSAIGKCPTASLALGLHGAVISFTATYYVAGDIIPAATEDGEAKEAKHDLFVFKLTKVKFNDAFQNMLSTFTQKYFEKQLENLFK